MNASLLRQLLFTLPPEVAHVLVLKGLNLVPNCLFPSPVNNPVMAMGLSFVNRIGIAAGLDVDGEFISGLNKLGSGFIEIGTVTPAAQAGNAKPRLFRLRQQRALINRMGFNNQGVHALIERLKQTKSRAILGINIGKNKSTPLNQAVQDYALCFETVYAWADYVTLNVSSPNTENLRQLQTGDYFSNLLAELTQRQSHLADQHQRRVPLVIKCSPDESAETLKFIAQEALKYRISGLIATNTTITRPHLIQGSSVQESGGLSGPPLFELATKTLQLLKAEVGNEITLIAAGGIEDERTAQVKLDAGASLLQVYTGLIYQGPKLIQRLGGLNPAAPNKKRV